MVLLFVILSGNNCEDQLSNNILMLAAPLQAYQSNLWLCRTKEITLKLGLPEMPNVNQ